MNPAQLPLHQQLVHLRSVLVRNKTLITVLTRAATLNLPNCLITISRDRDRDYDLVYYDSSDLSYEAEDKIIEAGRLLFEDLPVKVEIRNQARVHLWYGKKHGIHCAPHQSVEAGIDSWISTSAMIGIRLEDSGEWSIDPREGDEEPLGVEDEAGVEEAAAEDAK
ncbi:hypothetical protein G7Y89_g15781 [Cudoniella acicularis]|uniref:Uncharacterized protein n=1 Tax=Cudoniella acicularis TaxID=354080 RepID=A0A8H4QF33_9HELO|nr:hypothetical protein G7Y89_g15781 [Cudoniella acicularis]